MRKLSLGLVGLMVMLSSFVTTTFAEDADKDFVITDRRDHRDRDRDRDDRDHRDGDYDDRWDDDRYGRDDDYDRDHRGDRGDRWDRDHGRFGRFRAQCRSALVNRMGRPVQFFQGFGMGLSFEQAKRRACRQALNECEEFSDRLSDRFSGLRCRVLR